MHHEEKMAEAQRRINEHNSWHVQQMLEADQRIEALEHEKAMREAEQRINQLDYEKGLAATQRRLKVVR